MSLLSKINDDFLTAYKAHDEAKVSVLRLLKSALKNSEIDKKSALSEDDVIAVIKREIKQREQSALEYEKGGRLELADKEKKEILTLRNYLPQQIDETELKEIITATIDELKVNEPSQVGKVIGAVIAKVGNKANGGDVARIANELIKK